MKKLLTLSLILLPFICSAQKSASAQTVNDFKKLAWILNKWERTGLKQGATAFESWTKESDNSFTGIGVNMRGSDTTFVEKLRIEIKDDKIYYVADVRENASPTYFLMSEITEHGFTSKNPDHDFPKVISYSLDGNQLTAIISDGADKKIPFVFKKAK
ncbi:MAG: hypothetical protein COW03_08105 [Cytophagales bacterium CG12_big_fil_rev_8_21_14_0_65_40_12]|nr:MAG: hypothetical protein COW03_08105 [Cytophagales bacterium CG12_big_fil_rev_8_21_14_0_65_40_12]PIW06294.1 MAG: hypothetical protein COW40_00390 [Cytophagales bacterium CG17_big_fil_post_rev_8_21_14_2_50_40_13]